MAEKKANTPEQWMNLNTKWGLAPESIRHLRPLYREAVRLHTNLSGKRLEAFVDRTIERNSRSISSAFMNVKTPSQANDAIAQFKHSMASTFDADLKQLNQYDRDINYSDEFESKASTGKPILRSRFILPGTDTLKESFTQSASDVIQSELFTFKTTNDANGPYNSIHLDNLRNARMNSEDAGVPRNRDNLESLVLPFNTAWQFEDQQNVVPELQGMARDEVTTAILMNGPAHSYALRDQSMQKSQLTGRSQDTVMTQVIQIDNMKRDRDGPLPMGEIDYIGFHRNTATLRQPLEPSRFPYVNPYSQKQTLDREERGIGFDWLY